MARCRLSRVLPYSPDELFTLVGDVRRYPEFVPWLSGMRVWNERTESESVSSLDAEVSVVFYFLRVRVATRVPTRRRGPAHRGAPAGRLVPQAQRRVALPAACRWHEPEIRDRLRGQ